MSEATFDPTRYNRRKNESFASILERRMSRRRVLSNSCGAAALSMFTTTGLIGCGGDSKHSSPPQLNFESIAGAKRDVVVVPEKYQAQVLAPWGTPINDGAEERKADGSNTSEDQANAVGMHHDSMRFFPIAGNNTAPVTAWLRAQNIWIKGLYMWHAFTKVALASACHFR